MKKLKGCVFVDRASRLAVASGLKLYDDAWDLLADSALYYTSSEMREFCDCTSRGPLEQIIGRLKAAVRRTRKESLGMSVITMFQLACHAHNSIIQPSGYAPFQWTRGAFQQDQVPLGADPRAFGIRGPLEAP